MSEWCATLHACGAELPFTLGDGWTFAGSYVRASEDGEACYLLALWKRGIE